MRRNVLVLAAIILFAGCQSILIKAYGIKDPKVENEQTITRKALKYGLDTSNIVTVSSKDFPGTFKGKAIPDAAIYDKDGKYIEYRRTDTSCNAGLFQFIPDLTLDKSYNKPDSLPLKRQLEKFRDMKGGKLKEIKPADFYLCIYWTVWTGKLNKDHVKAWEDLAKKNKNCNIRVIKVNLDVQEYWEKSEQEKVIQALNKKK